MATASGSGATVTEDLQYCVPTGAADAQSLAVEAQRRENSRLAWQDVIDDKLIEWGRNPEQLADEDLIPPSKLAVDSASQFAIDLRDEGAAPPNRVVPNGDGGIVFKRWEGLLLETYEIYDDGSIEYACYDDCRLILCEPVCQFLRPRNV